MENFNLPTHEKLLFILKILQRQQSLTKCGKSAEIVDKGYSHNLFSYFSESTSWLPSFSLCSTPMVTTLLTKTPLYCRWKCQQQSIQPIPCLFLFYWNRNFSGSRGCSGCPDHVDYSRIFYQTTLQCWIDRVFQIVHTNVFCLFKKTRSLQIVQWSMDLTWDFSTKQIAWLWDWFHTMQTVRWHNFEYTEPSCC